MRLAEFVSDHGIYAAVERVDSNPKMEEMGPGARHWLVTLRLPQHKRRLRIPFSQGSAHTKEPTAVDVLDCLASDSAGIENARSFEDWCGEYGYDTDSRKAERVYKACVQQAISLRAFLGDEAYQQLLWNIERE